MTDLTPYGVLLHALDGNKELVDKCVAALFDYAIEMEYGNNQEPVIRMIGFEWSIIDRWDDDGSLM